MRYLLNVADELDNAGTRSRQATITTRWRAVLVKITIVSLALRGRGTTKQRASDCPQVRFISTERSCRRSWRQLLSASYSSPALTWKSSGS